MKTTMPRARTMLDAWILLRSRYRWAVANNHDPFLCCLLDDIESIKRISRPQAESMRRKIRWEMERVGRFITLLPYQRAPFLRRQIDTLTARKKVTK